MHKTVRVQLESGARVACACPPELELREGDRCVVENDRFQETAQVEQISEHKDPPPKDANMARVLRCCTYEDDAAKEENEKLGKTALETCRAKAAKYGLPLKMLKARYSLDRTALVVIASGETHADIREMVKELTGELGARIEVRQVGVRDEAAIIGGFGPCGRGLCCATWLKTLVSVNVKMAKTQGLSLTPAAIAGVCGRLKCCLRFEHGQYEQTVRDLPRLGETVQSPDGRGRVIGRDLLRGKIRLQLEDSRVAEFDARDVHQERGPEQPPEREKC